VARVVGRLALHPGGGPEQALRPGALLGQGLPARRGQRVLAERVGEPRVGDGSLAVQARHVRRGVLPGAACGKRREPLVGPGVDPADEERRHALDAVQAAAGRRALLKAGEESVESRPVALGREDQDDVDADPLGQAGRDRRQ